MDEPFPELPKSAFAKLDTGDDLTFYKAPRLVTHIDEVATAALTDFYRARIPEGARVLDLMSSWVSHLPEDGSYAEVVGHGMNAEELGANPRLDRWFVQDFNQNPVLTLDDQSFDAALVCAGVQYLQRPAEVFNEVRRVLVAGAPFIVSFSNRCFPTKAVEVWRSLDISGHAALVKAYLERAGFTDVQVGLLADGRTSDPLVAATGRA
jgi:SAM-dependent methyltransferase